MTRTLRLPYPTGSTLYALPIDQDPFDGDVAIEGDDTAVNGIYVFAALEDAVEYVIRKQAGGSPAESDRAVGGFDAVVQSGLTEGQAEQLDEIYAAIFPEDPDDPSVVITPGTGSITTGYLTCLDLEGAAQEEVTVYCQLMDPPADGTGFAYSTKVQSEESAANGVVEFPMLKGCSYHVWRSSVKKPEGLDLITIPTDAGSTYELPSLRGL